MSCDSRWGGQNSVEHRRQTTSRPRVPEWSGELRGFDAWVVWVQNCYRTCMRRQSRRRLSQPERAILGALDNFVIVLPICVRRRSVMITRHLLVAFAIVVASTMSVSTECVILTAKQVMSQPSFEIVFSGRVVDVKAAGANGYRATFEVDRVWKGTVPARIDLYVPPSPAEVPRFNKGTRYVAV